MKADEVSVHQANYSQNQGKVKAGTKTCNKNGFRYLASPLELVDLIVDQVVHLGVETGGQALLRGELINGRVGEGVLGLVGLAIAAGN
jgi:hypothetical protein